MKGFEIRIKEVENLEAPFVCRVTGKPGAAMGYQTAEEAIDWASRHLPEFTIKHIAVKGPSITIPQEDLVPTAVPDGVNVG
ncbi:unnamed protein product [marine sediment metagenome]|uniref:Uncharacterized protein n=1 Tax=marine sediment metagenome TaxID=412755 RepID=X0RPA5_9ZZZZ